MKPDIDDAFISSVYSNISVLADVSEISSFPVYSSEGTALYGDTMVGDITYIYTYDPTANTVQDSKGTVPIELTVVAATFNVTVPTNLPITVGADGEITVAEKPQIVNNGKGPVEVTSISIKGANGWTYEEWSDSTD